MAKYNRKLGSKREQGIKTPKAPQNRPKGVRQPEPSIFQRLEAKMRHSTIMKKMGLQVVALFLVAGASHAQIGVNPGQETVVYGFSGYADVDTITAATVDHREPECWDCASECCSSDMCDRMCLKVCDMGNKVFKDHCESQR